MQSEVERTLRNLVVVSMLKQHDKLITNTDTYAIYPPTVLRGVCRKWYGETRELNVQRVTETVHTAIETVHRMVRRNAEAVVAGASSSSPEEEWQLQQERLQCNRLVDALSEARRGLTNMIDTYADDTSFQVRLRVLSDRVNDFLVTVEERASPPVRTREDRGLGDPPPLTCGAADGGGWNPVFR